LPHQFSWISETCKVKKITMPEIAIAQEKAAEATKLY
jgi:hypothetical protein